MSLPENFVRLVISWFIIQGTMVLVEVLVYCFKLGLNWEEDLVVAFVALNTWTQRFPIWRRLAFLLCTAHRPPLQINWLLIVSSVNFLFFSRNCWASSGGRFQFRCWCAKWSLCLKIHWYSRITRPKTTCYGVNPCLWTHPWPVGYHKSRCYRFICS